MEAVEFLKEKNRMMIKDVNSYNELKNIPTNEEVVKFVEQWSKEHHRKTRLHDFLEKYPKSKIEYDYYSEVCCEVLGYCEECKHGYDADACKDCWNEPVE